MVKNLEPPYYAVIFTSKRTSGDKGYEKMSAKMEELVLKQKGFLGIDHARDKELGITISYWDSLEAIQSWKENAAHKIAQDKGKLEWYEEYHVKISKVEREYSFNRKNKPPAE